MKHTFEYECENCGSVVVFETDAEQVEGHEWYAYDGDEGTCQECGAVHAVSADGESAHISWYDSFADKGQHRAGEACDVHSSFHGQLCSWDCPQEKKDG